MGLRDPVARRGIQGHPERHVGVNDEAGEAVVVEVVLTPVFKEESSPT